MTGPDPVVVGVDGTWIALGALAWAATEARLRGAALHVVYAAPDDGGTRVPDVLGRATALARGTGPDLAVTSARVDGPPAAALLDESTRAGLLVVAMARRDRVEEVVLGSVGLDVSGRASCPVAVVRGEHRLPGGTGPVLVGVDTVTGDAAALTAAFDDARRHGSPVRVLHAHPAERGPAAHVTAWNRLCDELAPWSDAHPDVPVDVEIVRDDPAPALLAAAADARLVVVGSRGRSTPVRTLFGSTSRDVLRRCPTPVLVLSPAAAHRGPAPVAVPIAFPVGQAPARTERDHPQALDRLW